MNHYSNYPPECNGPEYRELTDAELLEEIESQYRPIKEETELYGIKLTVKARVKWYSQAEMLDGYDNVSVFHNGEDIVDLLGEEEIEKLIFKACKAKGDWE